ncbi:hypothetical protein HDK90DRAFT_540938 [Phyllosticta capitalensis]|uniref:BTB domain-containing protein n=1 Tax=Phyllosticta capitalensis TaxID=121624 RepID=A0ABR1YDX0_9PEZI
MILENEDPSIVKLILEYYYTGTFFDIEVHSGPNKEKKPDIEQQLYTCIMTYNVAHKFESWDLKRLILDKVSQVDLESVTNFSPHSPGRSVDSRITPAGVGRIVRNFETAHIANGRMRSLILCELILHIDTFAQHGAFMDEVDKIKNNFWRQLARFKAIIKARQIKLQSVEAPHVKKNASIDTSAGEVHQLGQVSNLE